jgi:hypothetical protein
MNGDRWADDQGEEGGIGELKLRRRSRLASGGEIGEVAPEGDRAAWDVHENGSGETLERCGCARRCRSGIKGVHGTDCGVGVKGPPVFKE